MIRKYRKKFVVEALRYDGTPEGLAEIAAAFGAELSWLPRGNATIRTLEGTMVFRPGDFVIKGIRGEVYACDGRIFAETYEEVAE